MVNPLWPVRPGDFGGHPRSGRAQGLLPTEARPQRHCVRTWGSPRRRRPLLNPTRSLSRLGLNHRFLFNSQYIGVSKHYKIFSWKPLDNKFPIWYNKMLSPLEPGESYLLLIENRIPNNRYVPVVACAGRATWLMQPDRRIATGGCAMTDSGVNDTSVRSCRRTRPGVRRPWRQPATVRLLWLHMVLASTV